MVAAIRDAYRGRMANRGMSGADLLTRFYPEKGRRLFIFKNYQGLVRPMWLGSKLGGILQDFHYHEGRVRSLETNVKGQYTVAEYLWDDFGLAFERFLIRDADEAEARRIFEP